MPVVDRTHGQPTTNREYRSGIARNGLAAAGDHELGGVVDPALIGRVRLERLDQVIARDL